METLLDRSVGLCVNDCQSVLAVGCYLLQSLLLQSLLLRRLLLLLCSLFLPLQSL